MTKRLLFCGWLFFTGFFCQAQTDSLSTKYREDQFFLSFSLQLQQENFNGLKQNGFSNNFQIGFVRDFPINEQGTFALGLGIGYGYNRLVSNLQLDGKNDNTIAIAENNPKNLQTFSSLVFPVSIRLRTSSFSKTDFWRLYGGLKYKLHFSPKFKPFYGSTFQNANIRNNNTSVFLSMGYNKWNLCVEYDLNSIYTNQTLLPSGAMAEIKNLKLGLIFYFL